MGRVVGANMGGTFLWCFYPGHYFQRLLCDVAVVTLAGLWGESNKAGINNIAYWLNSENCPFSWAGQLAFKTFEGGVINLTLSNELVEHYAPGYSMVAVGWLS
jgi:hypothetical protein